MIEINEQMKQKYFRQLLMEIFDHPLDLVKNEEETQNLKKYGKALGHLSNVNVYDAHHNGVHLRFDTFNHYNEHGKNGFEVHFKDVNNPSTEYQDFPKNAHPTRVMSTVHHLYKQEFDKGKRIRISASKNVPEGKRRSLFDHYHNVAQKIMKKHNGPLETNSGIHTSADGSKKVDYYELQKAHNESTNLFWSEDRIMQWINENFDKMDFVL